MKQKGTWYILFICVSIISSNSFSQHASFQGLGDFPGGEFNSSAQKVSADGSVIIGYGVTASGEQAFRWTQTTGMVSLGNLPDSSFKQSWANSISANGNVIVGYGDPVGSGWNTYKGFIWTDTGGMKEMGSLDSSTRFMAFNVSADGSVVVGDGGQETFRWTQQSGIEGLGVLPGKTNSRAVDISNDGSVIIGQSYSLPAWNDEDGFIWTQSGGMRGMASLTGGKYCMLLVISPDGSVIAGTTQSSSTYPAFLWTDSKGMVTIGHLPGRNTTHPTDMTNFGKIIVGGSFSGPTSGDAFIWDSTNGMRKLQTVLQTEYGLNLTGWTLQNAGGITPDGNVIVGHGINPSGKQEAFRVVLDTLETVTDIDGNVYQTIKIGTQVWMKENLKTTRYRNGDTIGTTSPATKNYFNESAPKYQWAYNGDERNVAVYGRLYTGYAATDRRGIAPVGWHVPTSNEWRTLIQFLGGASKAHGKLKETDTTHWKSPNSDATNESSFTGLPVGMRGETTFVDMGITGHYWAADEQYPGWLYRLLLNYEPFDTTFFLNSADPANAWAVRCIKDATTGVDESKNGKQIPEEMTLHQNYPNPFNPSTKISYRLPVSGEVELSIYNLLGQKIKTLVNSFQSAGEHSVTWDATDNSNNPISSGVYFYKMETKETSIQKKMMLIR